MIATKPLTSFFVSLLTLGLLASGAPCRPPPSSSSTRVIPSPTPSTDTAPQPAPSTGFTSPVTPAQILIAAPGSDVCSDPAQTSCRTAEQAAPFINQSFEKYNFTTAGEQAALLSLMALESGSFKFDVNLFPGRPGQGTRNMMTFPFILEYALEFDPQGVAAIAPDLTADSPADAIDAVPDATKNAIRALVLGDELSFASAAWFLHEKCTPDIAEGLRSGSDAAYDKYMTACIFTTNTPERLDGYHLALSAFTA